MPKITITIDPSACILAANCAGMEPKLFKIAAEPYVELTDPHGKILGTQATFDATDAELEKIEDAADSCPTQAINVTRA